MPLAEGREGGRRDSPRALLAGLPSSRIDAIASGLAGAGLEVAGPMAGDAAWESFEDVSYDLVIADLHAPELTGLALLRRIRSAQSRDSRVPVFLMSPDFTPSIAAAAGRAGVTDCFSLDEAGVSALIASARALFEASRAPIPYVLLGGSTQATDARERVLALAELDTPVLLSGERGLGQWQIASFLHRSGKLADSPLRCVDCTAQPDAEPGGEPGTWFLEEIQDLSPKAQLAWHEHIASSDRTLGSFRLIASSNRDLRALTAHRQFSPDLSRALAQFEVVLPPLRERREDLPKLLRSVLEVVAERIGRPSIDIAPGGVERLCAHAWWQNFDELESTLESLTAFATTGEITEAAAELVIIDSDPVTRAARDRLRSEREQLLRLLDEHGGNFTRIAEHLKVDRGTIRYRLRKHGLLPSGGSEGGRNR
jgi:two-component system response regulator PilR (NtrC family)